MGLLGYDIHMEFVNGNLPYGYGLYHRHRANNTYSCYLEANNMRTDGENESSLPQGQHKQHSQHKRINRNSRPPLRNSGNQTPDLLEFVN